MPPLKETETSLPYVPCFLCLVCSSIKVSIFHTTWLDTFWTDLGVYGWSVSVVHDCIFFLQTCHYLCISNYLALYSKEGATHVFRVRLRLVTDLFLRNLVMWSFPMQTDCPKHFFVLWRGALVSAGVLVQEYHNQRSGSQ